MFWSVYRQQWRSAEWLTSAEIAALPEQEREQALAHQRLIRRGHPIGCDCVGCQEDASNRALAAVSA